MIFMNKISSTNKNIKITNNYEEHITGILSLIDKSQWHSAWTCNWFFSDSMCSRQFSEPDAESWAAGGVENPCLESKKK